MIKTTNQVTGPSDEPAIKLNGRNEDPSLLVRILRIAYCVYYVSRIYYALMHIRSALESDASTGIIYR